MAAKVPSRPYDRRTELPRVLPLWPYELDDLSPRGRFAIVRKLRRALRAERCRGIAGHWTYDLARHIDLLRVYRLELASAGLDEVRLVAMRKHELAVDSVQAADFLKRMR